MFRTAFRPVVAAIVGFLAAAPAHAQATDEITSDPQSAGAAHQAYLECRLRYLQNPIPAEAVSLIAAGSSSDWPEDRVESARLGHEWLRDGALSGAAAERVRASLRVSAETLAQIAFARPPTAPVRVDAEAVPSDALQHGWDVVPGPHRVAIGKHVRVVTTNAGELVTLDATAWANAPMVAVVPTPKATQWSDGKLAVEGTLALCALAGAAAGLVMVTADDTHAGHEDRNLVGAAIGFGAGSACLLGAVLVPVLWKNEPRTPRSSSITWRGSSLRGTF